MDVTIYFKRGDISSSRGLVIDNLTYDDDFFGEPPFWGERITEEEYIELSKYFEAKEKKYGFDGIVDKEGYNKYLKEFTKFSKNEE